jgi:hypothetical protein
VHPVRRRAAQKALKGHVQQVLRLQGLPRMLRQQKRALLHKGGIKKS